ncbi:MAG: hypothetical protein LBU65_00060 [Planctomycetaceae bacterium]|nr:hypothetical protein [Planctomycetaceae bacterium]
MISPRLANVYLHWFDRAFHGKDGLVKMVNARLIRYADDFGTATPDALLVQSTTTFCNE